MLVGNTENRKQNCEFGEEIVAYLYDELAESQKRTFNLHLENCAGCTEEVKSFASIHSSIQDWKAAKFDSISTPVIEIPSFKSQMKANQTSVSSSWFYNIREKFSFGGILIPVGAMALILIFAAFAVFYFNFSNKNEIADGNANKTLSEISPAAENTGDAEKSKIEKNSESEVLVPVTNQNQQEEIAVEKNKSPVESTELIKASVKPENLRKERKTVNKNKDKQFIKSNKITQPPNNPKIPKLNNLPEESEVEELRLADLFAEIGDR